MLVACRDKSHEQPPQANASSPPTAAPTAAAAVSAAVSEAATEAGAAAVSDAGAAAVSDAGAEADAAAEAGADAAAEAGADAGAATGMCALQRGPIQLPFTGPVLVRMTKERADEPEVIFNDDGKARPVKLPTPSPNAKPGVAERLELAEAPPRATAPSCVAAGAFLFCADKGGDIHRYERKGGGEKIIAHMRSGAPMAAAAIGSDHTVVVFLGDRKTTEGVVTLAFAVLDDTTPMLLSEEGSGATFITLAPRGEDVVAMYIDSRTALTPLHARTLSLEGDKLRYGEDAVLFVGEGSGSRALGAVALGPAGPGFALIPSTKDITTFGMAAIRIDDKPQVDAPVTWSPYPNGIDRGPIAATVGIHPVRVARVRPVSKEPGAKQVIELGELDPSGTFKPHCEAATSSRFSDLDLTVDRTGALWLSYTDAKGTWIERHGVLK